MPVFSLPLIPISAFTFDTDPLTAETYWQDGQGDSWNDGTPPSFSFAPGSLAVLQIEDDEGLFDDDDPKFQTLVGGATLNGRDWPAGFKVENEYMITVQDADGNTYEMVAVSINEPGDRSDTIVGFTFDTSGDNSWPPAGVQLSYVPDSARDIQKIPYPQPEDFPCFARGTMIETAQGLRAIEDLAEGDLIVTRDNGLQALRWIGSVQLGAEALAANPKLRPIRIAAGALGEAVPAQDLLVSPQHRMLVRSRIAQRMFGTSEVLVAAKQLVTIDGVDVAEDVAGVEYFHMLFDRHEVVIANGAESESLFTGPEALKMVGKAAREEIFTLFPELRLRDYAPVSARPLVSGRQGRKMAMRHVQNGRALVN